jgi:SepF-like predicted cell division protein (DUF552 family)
MVLKNIFGKKETPRTEEDIDIENYLSDLSIRDGKIIEREDVVYVKPIELDSEGKGVGTVIKELEKGNIVLLSIRKVIENQLLLRNITKELTETVEDLNGDIGRLSMEKILLVPEGIHIVHRAHKRRTEDVD